MKYYDYEMNEFNLINEMSMQIAVRNAKLDDNTNIISPIGSLHPTQHILDADVICGRGKTGFTHGTYIQ